MSKKIYNICIIGGGNIGTLLLGDLGRRNDISVNLFTGNSHKWNKVIDVYDNDDNFKYSASINTISSDPKEVISKADIIISTLPSQVFPNIINEIKAYIKPGTWIGVMPGSGGAEFYCTELINKGCILFGFQRVHGVSRIKEYGKSVYDLGKKDKLYIAAIPQIATKDVCNKIQELLEIECVELPNYLNVTLTPSNPILHTTRLYSLFSNYNNNMYWDKIIEFYSEWDDDSSDMLIKCDNELQNICRKISELDLEAVKSLKEHYESDTIEKMTNKIRSIKAFKGIGTPMCASKNGYIPDFTSRYFLEDFSYGLCIIKGFADILNINTPSIDKVLKWYEKIMSVEYFINDRFEGKDLDKLPIPKNFGIKSREEIIAYYKR